jgi:hypothetical protein
MNHSRKSHKSRKFRWARRAVWGTLAVVMTIGCNPLATFAFLTHRDTPLPAKYPLFPKDSPRSKKDEVKVAVFVDPGIGQTYEFAGAPGVVASEMAKRMPEMAKENKRNLVVISPQKVNEYKMKNPTWNKQNPIVWGKALGVDYVLDVHLTKMSLYQPGNENMLYEGRAEVEVELYDVAAGGEPEYYVHPFSYPRTGFLDATTIPVGTFKKKFLERLAVEIAQYHLDYLPDSGIAEARW